MTPPPPLVVNWHKFYLALPPSRYTLLATVDALKNHVIPQNPPPHTPLGRQIMTAPKEKLLVFHSLYRWFLFFIIIILLLFYFIFQAQSRRRLACRTYSKTKRHRSTCISNSSGRGLFSLEMFSLQAVCLRGLKTLAQFQKNYDYSSTLCEAKSLNEFRVQTLWSQIWHIKK